MVLEKGSRVGKYEIMGRLGGFGVGEVYRARETRLGREVAVKVIGKDEVEGVEAAMSRAITLFHPNIGAILEFHVGSELSCAVLEFYEGETIRQRLGRGRLPFRDCAMIGSDVALGLAAAHERGIAHGSLTPASVLVGYDGRLKILDFGMVATEGGGFTSTVELDCLALGRLLFEAATGEALDAVVSEHSMDEVRLGLVRVGAPDVYADVVQHCLSVGSSDRNWSCREIALELRSQLTESGSMLPTLPSRLRHPIWRIAVILFVIAVVLGIILVLVFEAEGGSLSLP